MTLQELRYLVALADHGHFGRAAASCRISQPTLSTQLKKLEESLGVVLFERTNKTVRMTAIAEDIVARARRVLAETESIADVAKRKSAPLTGRFVLGVIPTLGPYLLPSLIPALRQAHSKLRLSVHEDIAAALLDGVAAHRIDAALMALPIQYRALDTLPLFDEPFWFAAPRGHRLAKGRAISERELRGQRLLLLPEGHCLRDQVLAICGATADPDGEDFHATSLETIRQLVTTGMGCTLLPALAASGWNNDTIVMRPLTHSAGRQIGLVWRRSYTKLEDLRMIIDTIRNQLPKAVKRA